MKAINSDYITLQQFLKLAGIADSGGQAKMMIQNREVKVNGEVEERRGRKLYDGDEVIAAGRKFLVR